MPRQSRKKSSTGIYHVMLRGINKQDVFEEEEDYVRMKEILNRLNEVLTGTVPVSLPCGFSEQLLRETATDAQFSGNIGSMLWRNTSTGEQHRYDYTYDALGRLTSSLYSSSAIGTEGRFDETVTYNANGSIMSLLRNGMKNDGTFGAIDDLTVTYDGNRLMKVTDDAEALNYNGALDFDDGADTACEYDYDSNGALTRDDNRGINSITYDYSHHPSKIFRSTKKKTVYNDYTPDGMKLSSRHVSYIPTGNGGNYRIYVRDLYVDGLMLRGDTTLLWQFDGGYVDLNANGTPTSWNYYVTDHLGSTRMVVDSNNNIKETINYYPFGSEIQMTNPALLTGDTSHPFRFTGKELDKLNSLNMYDFGARWYDVAGVPMWTSVDPLAEKYYPLTPYSYCAGNPVNKIDPDGRAVNLLAGGIGAIAGAAINASVAYLEGKDSKEILGAAAEGAIVGGVTGLTLGASTTITASSVALDASIGALSSGAGNAANQFISKGEVNGREVAGSMAVGASSGAMGAVGGAFVNKSGEKAIGAITTKAENTVANARNLAYSQVEQTGAQMGGKYAKQQVNRETGNIIREAQSSASSAIKATKTITKGKNWSVQMGIGVITGKASEYYHSTKNKVKSIFDKFF